MINAVISRRLFQTDRKRVRTIMEEDEEVDVKPKKKKQTKVVRATIKREIENQSLKQRKQVGYSLVVT